jgi:hypothetical protein
MSFLIFSACVSHFFRSETSLRVLRRMFNWVRIKLVNCPEGLLVPVWVEGAMDEEIETVGE